MVNTQNSSYQREKSPSIVLVGCPIRKSIFHSFCLPWLIWNASSDWKRMGYPNKFYDFKWKCRSTFWMGSWRCHCCQFANMIDLTPFKLHFWLYAHPYLCRNWAIMGLASECWNCNPIGNAQLWVAYQKGPFRLLPATFHNQKGVEGKEGSAGWSTSTF